MSRHDRGVTWETIPDMALSSGDRFGDAEAVVDGPLRLTFAELADRVRVAAGAFRIAGVGAGDPAEVEGHLLAHPAVAQAAVLGVPDGRLGQVDAAFVVPSAVGAGVRAADAAALIAWCRSRMAEYKVPRSVEFVTELPVNAAGKVDKVLLAARAAVTPPPAASRTAATLPPAASPTAATLPPAIAPQTPLEPESIPTS